MARTTAPAEDGDDTNEAGGEAGEGGMNDNMGLLALLTSSVEERRLLLACHGQGLTGAGAGARTGTGVSPFVVASGDDCP